MHVLLDLRNLLTVAGSCVDSMLALGTSDDLMTMYASELSRYVDHMVQMVDELLPGQQATGGSAEPIEMNIVVLQQVEMLRSVMGRQVEIALKLHPGRSEVLAREGDVERILINLVLSARAAMPADGSVTLATSIVPADFGHEDTHARQYVRLSVHDTGSASFNTSENSGRVHDRALSIASVELLARRLGGRLSIEPLPGGGTSVHVDLQKL